jgi:hypothetical protein
MREDRRGDQEEVVVLVLLVLLVLVLAGRGIVKLWQFLLLLLKNKTNVRIRSV